MIRHSIDVTPSLSNSNIHTLIKYALSDQIEDKKTRLRAVGSVLHSITNKVLLENTIELLRSVRFFEKADKEFAIVLNNLLNYEDYSTSDLIRIKGIYYDCWFQYELLNRSARSNNQSKLPVFKIVVKDREVLTNEDAINDFYSTNGREEFISYLKSIPSQKGQVNELKKAIYTLSESDFKHDTDIFAGDLRKLEYLKNNSLTEAVDEIDHPFYVLVGQFFYDGSIRKDKDNYIFRDKTFTSVLGLSKHVKNILKTSKSVRQYISDTLSNNGDKNFYDPLKPYRLQNVISYCKANSIKVNDTFLRKTKHLD